MQNVWIWVVVAIIVIGGGFWWFQSTQAPAVSDDGTPAATDVIDDSTAPQQPVLPTSSDTSTGAATSATVTYSGTSFTPSEVTIKKGGTVTFVDSSTRGMWVASGMHPEHTKYDGTSRSEHCASGYTGAAPFDQCSKGSSYSFTFDKVGTWGYHDHLNASAFGKIVVVE